MSEGVNSKRHGRPSNPTESLNQAPNPPFNTRVFRLAHVPLTGASPTFAMANPWCRTNPAKGSDHPRGQPSLAR